MGRIVQCLCVVLFTSLWSENSVCDETTRKPIEKVILISIDTLRADALGSYNPKAEATPVLDRFAQSNILFKSVTAQSSTTAPSHKSIFYSLYPSVHKTSIRQIPAETIRSPVEVIRMNGFRTAAFTGGGQLHHSFGFARGFESYWEPKGNPFLKNQTEEMKQAAFQWLDKHAKGKFFLFLHTYQVHCPYKPPEKFFKKWAGWYDGPIQNTCHGDLRSVRPPSSADYRFTRSLYSAEVNYVDSFMGELFQKLKVLDIYEDALIIFLADHGESLGERGYFGHNQLYEVQLRIPLLMRIPGIGSREIDAPLESLDVMPTIFELLKIASPPYPFQGKSLLPLIRNPSMTIDRKRPLISEQSENVRVKIGDLALLFSKDGKLPDYLYNLKSDPTELENLAEKNPEVTKMKLIYYRIMAANRNLSAQFVIVPGKKRIMDDETREQLHALGYVGN